MLKYQGNSPQSANAKSRLSKFCDTFVCMCPLNQYILTKPWLHLKMIHTKIRPFLEHSKFLHLKLFQFAYLIDISWSVGEASHIYGHQVDVYQLLHRLQSPQKYHGQRYLCILMEHVFHLMCGSEW